MKKLISFVLSLTLIFTIFVMPSSAETSVKDWAKAEGSHGIFFDEEGTKITLVDTLIGFYYYKKQVNVRDFTIKIKLNAPNLESWRGAWIITIGSGKYSGSSNGSTNVIFLWPKSDGTLVVQPALLYGAGLDNSTKTFKGDFKNNYITIKGKKVNDNTYSLDFNNGELYYEYPIPENQNYIENLGNGKGYLGFGSYGQFNENFNSTNSPYNIIIKEINGVAMNVKDAATSSKLTSSTNNTNSNTSSNKTSSVTTSTNSDKNNSTTTNLNSDETNSTTDSINSDVTGGETTDAATDINNNTSKNNKKTNKNTSQKNNAIIIFIVVLLLIVNIFIIAIFLIKKKKTKISVEQSEDLL